MKNRELKLWFAKNNLDYNLFEGQAHKFAKKYKLNNLEDLVMEVLQQIFLNKIELTDSKITSFLNTTLRNKYGVKKDSRSGKYYPVNRQSFDESQADNKIQIGLEMELV